MCETQAGRGALVSEHPLSLGAVGATGGAAANRLARVADVVIGIGTRWSDFTTASKSAFQDPDVRFVNINVASVDAGKHSGLPVLGDARVVLELLLAALVQRGHRAPADWTALASAESSAWAATVADLVAPTDHRPLRQAEVIGAVNDAAGETGVVVNAAGAMPGDLHKLWRARDPDGKGYHVEYGYSCMGYEIPGSIGVKLAAPQRRVFTLIGDGSWLMLSSELATAVAQRIPLTVIVVDNHGYMSIGALSRSLGSAGFATHYRRTARRHAGARRRRRYGARHRRGEPAGGFRRQRRQPRRTHDSCADHRRAAGCAVRGGRCGRSCGDLCGDRPLRRRPRLRELVGCARGGGVERTRRSAGARERYDDARTAQRVYLQGP